MPKRGRSQNIIHENSRENLSRLALYRGCRIINPNEREKDTIITDNTLGLGILTDSQLKLDLHINSMIAKAHARACLIFRCFVSKDRHSLIKAFITYVKAARPVPDGEMFMPITYVHPVVEYASCVWSPSSIG